MTCMKVKINLVHHDYSALDTNLGLLAHCFTLASVAHPSVRELDHRTREQYRAID